MTDCSSTDDDGRLGVAFHRTLDASLNRATEAMRLLEDLARFSLNDALLTRTCKELRHELERLVAAISPATARIRARNTPGDVGTDITIPSESMRDSLASLAASNFRRAQQAVRSLEEFAKLSPNGVAAELERVRYQLYSLEVPFTIMAESRKRLLACPLAVLVDGRASQLEFGSVVAELVAAGTPLIQLRDKRLSDQELWERACELVRRTRPAGVLCIVNDRVDIAAAAGADGVHLGQEDLPIAAARRQLPPNALVGASTHSLAQAHQAVMAGADYLGVGPVFPSQTKEFSELAGLSLVSQVTADVGLPCFAIGGISPRNLIQVRRAGASRLAVSHAVLSAASPGKVVRSLLEALAEEIAIPTGNEE